MGSKGNKLTRGIGINDMDYDVFKRLPEGKVWHCPIYRAWANMLTRVTHTEGRYSYEYDKDFGKSYYEVCVSDDWLKLSNFHAWYSAHDYVGKHLDKDLLGDGGLYSESSCCLIPPLLNSALKSRVKRTKGVVHNNLVGTANIQGYWYFTINHDSKVYAKARCKTEMEAHQHWQFYKAKLLREYSKELLDSGEISYKIYQAVITKAEKLDKDRLNGVITTKI